MARQSNVGSPPPPALDIDTPDGSVFGDYASSESQYEYPWPKQFGNYADKLRNNNMHHTKWVSSTHMFRCIHLTKFMLGNC